MPPRNARAVDVAMTWTPSPGSDVDPLDRNLDIRMYTAGFVGHLTWLVPRSHDRAGPAASATILTLAARRVEDIVTTRQHRVVGGHGHPSWQRRQPI